MLIAVSVLLLISVCGVAMCVRTGAPELISPKLAAHNLITWFRLGIARVFKQPLYVDRQSIITASPYYLETVARAQNLIITVLCGACIAMCGGVFQTVFRNPAAAPTMLGVSSGIELGILLLVLKYSVDVYSKTTERYLYCYSLAVIVLALVILLGRLVSGKRHSGTEMLLSGAIISQIMSVVMMYIRFRLELVDLETLQTISLYGFTMNTTFEFARTSLFLLIAIVIVCILPLFLMRFSFDVISYPDEEAVTLGLNPSIVRVIALIVTTFLMTSAILYCGSVGILSLIIPHICRFTFDSRFKSVFYGSALFGPLLLVICRLISSLIYVDGFGALPLGPLVGVVSAPLLAVVMMKRRGGLE